MGIRPIIVKLALLNFVSIASLSQQNSTAPRGTFATDTTDTQSLGSIAHQQQEQKPNASPSKHRVITNEDMPSHPAPVPAPEVKPRAQTGKTRPEAINQGKVSTDDDDDLLGAIRDEKEKIREMQSGLSELQAKLDTWKGDDCRQYYSETGLYYNSCPEVTKLIAERDHAKSALEKEQLVLAEMQEKARKAGFTSRQYDPD